MDWGPGGPRPVDQAHEILSSKINPKINYPRKFAKRPLSFFVIKPQSPKLPRRPLVFKIFPKISLSTSRNYKQAPITLCRHIFATVTLISIVLTPKFSESLPLLSYAFI
jgi:hypothetical protein